MTCSQCGAEVQSLGVCTRCVESPHGDGRDGLGTPAPGRLGDWCQVYGGGRFYPLDPRPEEIHIETIAHALSQLCRFGGHCSDFYSVAEHSVRVSFACHPKDALWGLLHDAAEAYLCDLPRPIKVQPAMAAYRVTEARVLAAVCRHFGLVSCMPDSVKVADERLLATEARDLMHRDCLSTWNLRYPPLPEPLAPTWPPRFAERRFLERYRQLTECHVQTI